MWVHGCVCVSPADGPPGPPRAVAARRDIAGAGGQPLRGVAATVAMAVAEATEATAAVAVAETGAAQRQWQRPGRRSGSGSARDSSNCSTRHPVLCLRFRLSASVFMPSPAVAMLSGGASGGHGGNAGSGGPPKLVLTVCGRRWRRAPAVAAAAPAVAVAAPAVATQSRVLQASPVPTESARKRWR